MFKKTPERVKLQRVSARPTEVDLSLFIETCRRDRTTKYSYFWTSTTSDMDFMLSVKYADTSAGYLAWRLYQGSGPNAKELWFHLTDNAQQIYTMIINSCGEELETAVKADQRSTGVKIHTVQSDPEDPQSHTFDGNSNKIPMQELEPLMHLRAALNGDLELVHITTVLQSLNTGQVSGRLVLQGTKGNVDIFIENGTPVHAIGPMGSGLDCLLQVIAWKQGKFNFEPHLKTDVKTIEIGLNALLMQGAHLQDNTNYLLEKGIRSETILARKRLQMPESEFDALIAKGEPIDTTLQKNFYLCIDDRSSLKEIINKMQLPRMTWVPLVANLIRCDLIIASSKVLETKLANVAPKRIDGQVLQQLNRTICRAETGLLAYPAMLFLLEHDLSLREGTDRPLSLVIFELHQEQAVPMLKTVPLPYIQSVCQRITQLKKPSDTLGHYENADFALIMPDTKPAAAKIFCERILENLDGSKFVKGIASAGTSDKALTATFGIASVPEHATTLALLLSSAEQAKYMAKSNHLQIYLGCQ